MASTGQKGLPAPVNFDDEMLVLVSMEGRFPDSFWHKPIPKVQVVADIGDSIAVQVVIPTKGNAGWIDLVKVKKSDKPVTFYFDHQVQALLIALLRLIFLPFSLSGPAASLCL